MNISNIKLNGINYNLTDKETQNLISQVQANTYTKEEIDNAIANISQGSAGDNYETFELRYEDGVLVDLNNDVTVDKLKEYFTSREHDKVRLILANHPQVDDIYTKIDVVLDIEHFTAAGDWVHSAYGYNWDYENKLVTSVGFSDYGNSFDGSVYIEPIINFNNFIDKNSDEGLSVDKLNTKLLTNENLNDIKDDFSAYYATNFTGTNKPSTISYAFGLICMRTFSNNFKQIITDATSDNSYVRYFRNATSIWSAWKKMLTEDDLPKTWIGTESEYNAITTKDANTTYYIKE